jgi:RimJ/RimL family protein N-acetyltransferase
MMMSHKPISSTLETSSGPVTIRPSRAEDAVAYRELRLQSLRDHPEAFATDYDETLARPIEEWQERMRRAGPDRISYVAEARGLLIGMTALRREDQTKLRHSATLVSVYVRPDWRGQGVADALIEACVDWARILGVRIVKLGVAATNVAAIRRYIRLGFSVYGVEPEMIFANGRYYDELLMARRLEEQA